MLSLKEMYKEGKGGVDNMVGMFFFLLTAETSYDYVAVRQAVSKYSVQNYLFSSCNWIPKTMITLECYPPGVSLRSVTLDNTSLGLELFITDKSANF